LKTLVSLGLSQTDAQIYINLATEGPAKARNIINDLQINKRQIYRSLKCLRNKGIAIANDERPFEFSAVPFEEVLDLLMEVKKEQVKSLQESREELVSSWQSNKKGKSENN
jgi:sugar-specific transcriptional regulator TrmB